MIVILRRHIMGNKKTENGTITKVLTQDFTKRDLEELWNRHDATLKELEGPVESYSRNLSDLIRSLRDISENLILAGAIPEATTRNDTASYVKKKLKENNIPFNNGNFYTYFEPEQKRPWQLGEDTEGTKSSDHKHEFQKIGKISGMGEVSRCGADCIPACQALLIEGRLFEQQELEEIEEKDPEPKTQKPKNNFEIENEDFIAAYEDAIARLKAVLLVWRTTDSNLTDKEKKELKSDLYAMKKAGEFLDMAYDRKNLIAPYTQHLLSLAYGEATQKHAGGAFLMYRIDLAKRKHGESVKFFKKAYEFAKLLSGKQTAKAMKGKIRILNPRYEPRTEKQAMDAGFSGQQCIDCKYRRVGYDQVLNINWKEGKPGWKEGDDPKDKPDPVHEKYDSMLVCFHCGEVQKREHFTLPKQVPLVTIDYEEHT